MEPDTSWKPVADFPFCSGQRCAMRWTAMTDICQNHVTFRAPKQNKSLVNIDENFLETLANFQSHKRHKNKSRTETTSEYSYEVIFWQVVIIGYSHLIDSLLMVIDCACTNTSDHFQDIPRNRHTFFFLIFLCHQLYEFVWNWDNHVWLPQCQLSNLAKYE